jgi:hypothetical protein
MKTQQKRFVSEAHSVTHALAKHGAYRPERFPAVKLRGALN